MLKAIIHSQEQNLPEQLNISLKKLSGISISGELKK
jgi:hypothetical protein